MNFGEKSLPNNKQKRVCDPLSHTILLSKAQEMYNSYQECPLITPC